MRVLKDLVRETGFDHASEFHYHGPRREETYHAKIVRNNDKGKPEFLLQAPYKIEHPCLDR